MKAGTLLLVIAGIIEILADKGLILPDGSFGDFSNLEADVQLANAVEDVLVKYGLDVPEKVTSIIQMLPIVMRLSGK